MVVSVIPIGNSKGIRIPKAILEQLNIKDKLDLEIEDKHLVLKPIIRKPREGWALELKEMGSNHDDVLILPDSGDPEGYEWEW